jgi:hypothetical protein
MDRTTWMLGAALIALGMALAGALAGQGYRQGRLADRYVTLKGIAERDVQADVALWPIRFVATADELELARDELTRSDTAVRAFLARQGIPAEAVEVHQLEVTDVLANPYRSGPVGGSRFIIAETLMVRSLDPARIQTASQAIGELVAAGVVLSAAGGSEAGPTYLFTGLTELKPEMIAEATANARRSAGQFAADAGSRLGGIRRANQGLFVILPRDPAPGMTEGGQRHKTVRVVATIDYFLTD